MPAQLVAPRVIEEPIVVHVGESFKLRVEVRDGARTATKPYGAGVEVNASTVKGILRISKPDDATDLARDTSVVGEGAKALTDQGSEEGLTKDAFEFYVAFSVTANWKVGIHDFEAEFQDTSPTVADRKLILIGRIDVRPKPSDAA